MPNSFFFQSFLQFSKAYWILLYGTYIIIIHYWSLFHRRIPFSQRSLQRLPCVFYCPPYSQNPPSFLRNTNGKAKRCTQISMKKGQINRMQAISGIDFFFVVSSTLNKQMPSPVELQTIINSGTSQSCTNFQRQKGWSTTNNFNPAGCSSSEQCWMISFLAHARPLFNNALISRTWGMKLPNIACRSRKEWHQIESGMQGWRGMNESIGEMKVHEKNGIEHRMYGRRNKRGNNKIMII